MVDHVLSILVFIRLDHVVGNLFNTPIGNTDHLGKDSGLTPKGNELCECKRGGSVELLLKR